MTKQTRCIWRVLAFAVFAGVRIVWLSMDPPSWLSWSAGLYTDEGFYSLDARHWAVFQHVAPGNFHDRLLSPGLSWLQQVVFGVAGVSDLSARGLSVAMSFATLILFWMALRRACGEDAADIGAGFLALAPAVVFYNRMALQETPACLFLASALCARAFADTSSGRRRTALQVLCGVAGASVVLFKPLGLIALPGVILAGRERGERGRLDLLASAGGSGALFIFWLGVHYLPNHVELARMGQYYRVHQTLPGSIGVLWRDVRQGFISRRSGLFPFLLATSPVLCCLAAYGGYALRQSKSAMDAVLWTWLACGVAYCLVMVYAPSRYYVLFFPALAGIAAMSCAKLQPVLRMCAVGLFCVVSMGWIGASFLQRKYTMADARLEIATLLPADAVIVGDIAPSLCMDSRIQAAPMQPGLSNDHHPVERLHASAIALVRSDTWDKWWTTHYPNCLDPKLRLGGWTIGPGYRVEVFRVRPAMAVSRYLSAH